MCHLQSRFAESQTVVASSGLVQMFMRDAKLHSWELPETGGRGWFLGEKDRCKPGCGEPKQGVCGPWAWSFCLSN